jgi:hypothetical protein
MALTPTEKRIVEALLRQAHRQAFETHASQTPSADFAGLTMAEQKAFLKPRVQAVRDERAAERANLAAETAARQADLDAQITVLDALLGKLT